MAGESMSQETVAAAPQRAPRREPGAAAVVWLVLVAMTLLGFGYVARYGSNVPSWDEWDMVPAFTGAQPVTWEWLWSQHNEHRVPVPRLVLVALNSFLVDFRISQYFNVLACAAAAAMLVWAARRLRGGVSSYADAFFPIAMLHWGHCANFIWGWQVEFTLSTLFATAALVIMAVSAQPLRLRTALLLIVCALLLTGTGGHGVALVPFLGAWLAYGGIRRMRDGDDDAATTPGGRREGAMILALALLCGLLTAAYFVGYSAVPYHPRRQATADAVRSTAKLLGTAFGPDVESTWRFLRFAVAGLVAVTAVGLLVPFRANRVERLRVAGVLVMVAAIGALAVAIGTNRSRSEFQPRYVTLIVPLWCAAFLGWVLWRQRPTIGRTMQYALLGVSLVLLPWNVRFAREYGSDIRGQLGAFERSMLAGEPPYQLIRRHNRYLTGHHDTPTQYLPLLRSAGVGPYRHLAEDPPFREISLPIDEPSDVRSLTWDAATHTARTTDGKAYLTFKLPRRQYVAGVVLRYDHTDLKLPGPRVVLQWKDAADADFRKEKESVKSPTGDRANWLRGNYLRRGETDTRVTTWVCDTMDELRVYPDGYPTTFKLYGVTLLVPPEGAVAGD